MAAGMSAPMAEASEAPALPQGISHSRISEDNPCRCCATTKSWGYTVDDEVDEAYKHLRVLLPESPVVSDGSPASEFDSSFSICSECYKYMERKFLDEIPFGDLPLYVNHDWLNWQLVRVFKDRFQPKELQLKEAVRAEPTISRGVL